MKNVIAIVLLSIISITYGQEQQTSTEKFRIEKGTWNLEGRFNINSNTREVDLSDSALKVFGFGIAPKVGYTIADNLILGLGVGYDYRESKADDVKTFDSKTISIFPYVKKFFPLSTKLAMHLQGEVKYLNSNAKDTESESEANAWVIGLRPGLTYKISDKVLLLANVGALNYSNGKSERKSEADNYKSEIRSFNFNLDASDIHFGIALNL